MSIYNYINLIETDSTNNYLKNNYETFPNNTFLSSAFQTSGKGQFGNTWEAENNKNILLSWLIKKVPYEKMLTIKRGISDAIIALLNKYNIKASFVYPNDIFVQNKKICGILIETKSNGICYDYIIVGIGLNVNQINFGEPKATSMKLIKRETYNVEALIKELIVKLTNDIIYK